MITTHDIVTRLLALSRHGKSTVAPFYLGIKLGPLRQLAKTLAPQTIDWSDMRYDWHYELNLIQGIIVAYSSQALIQKWEFYGQYFNVATDWSYVDSSLVSLPKRLDLASVNHAAIKYLTANDPYVRRFGYVLALRYLINTEYLPAFLEKIDPNEDIYHVYMAIAWFLAECYIKDRLVFEAYIEKAPLALWIRQKMVSKIRDSFRVTKEEKQLVLRYKQMVNL